MKILALIPARGGSKGIPKKNIYPLNGLPLIAYSILAAKLSAFSPRIVISTDSEEIATTSKRYGAEVPFFRPDDISGDRSGDLEFVTHALDWFESNEAYVPDYILHLRPTTPLRDPAIIDIAIQHFINSKEATCLRSAHKAPESPMKWFQKKDDGYFDSFIDVGLDINAPRQVFRDAYIPDGYIDILKPDFIRSSGQLHGSKILAFESPVCTEVDTFDALEYLEFEIQKNKHPLLGQIQPLLRSK